MGAILTLTMNPAVDVSSSVENVFPEHKLRCGSVRRDPGGGGINVSRVIKRLGGDAQAWHCSGGLTGTILCSLLDLEGVPHRPMGINGLTRENVSILETATGQQYRFVMPGPTLSEPEWQGVLERIRGLHPFPPLVVASGSLPEGVPQDFYGRVARIVQERAGRLIVDTSGPALIAPVEAGVFLIKPSLRELRSFARGEVEHEADQERTAMSIIDSGKCEVVIVSLAAAGLLVASRNGCERMRSPAVAVRSRVGSGDSMVAGIAVGLARGQKLRDAVRLGIAAGAAAVMNPGTELSHRDDVERLFREIA